MCNAGKHVAKEGGSSMTIGRFRRMRTVGAVAALFVASACGGLAGDGGGGDAATSEQDGVTKMEITVTHWPSLLYGVPYMVAMEKGYFEEEGIEITGIIGSEGGGTTVRNILTGGLPMGEVATPAAVQAAEAGGEIAIVAGGVAGIDEINWVTEKDSDVNSIEDLDGKKVAFSEPGSVTEALINLSLDRAGIDVDNVDLIAAGGITEGLTALEGGGVDAAANLEPVFSAEGGEDTWNVVFEPTEFVPAFQQTVILASPKLIEENPEAITAFLTARQRGIEFIQDNIEETATIYAEYSELPKKATLSALEAIDLESYYTTGLNIDGLTAVQEEMELLGLIEEGKTAPWDELINQGFLPEGTEEIDPASIGG